MKSNVANLRGRRGTTLLEIIIVLSIMVLIVTIGAASFMFFSEEDQFEKPASQLRNMAKLAHQSALLQQRGMTIAFDKEGFALVGSSEAGTSHYDVPGDMKVLIHRLGGKGWEKAEGHLWQFGAQGICEPVKIRFEDGDDSFEVSFHPLTGAPIES